MTYPPFFFERSKTPTSVFLHTPKKHVWSPIFGMHAGSETFRIRMIRSWGWPRCCFCEENASDASAICMLSHPPECWNVLYPPGAKKLVPPPVLIFIFAMPPAHVGSRSDSCITVRICMCLSVNVDVDGILYAGNLSKQPRVLKKQAPTSRHRQITVHI